MAVCTLGFVANLRSTKMSFLVCYDRRARDIGLGRRELGGLGYRFVMQQDPLGNVDRARARPSRTRSRGYAHPSTPDTQPFQGSDLSASMQRLHLHHGT
jgi:hypothetical protein